MNGGGVANNPVAGVALGTAVNGLLTAITRLISTANKFTPVLNHLRDTVNWISPRIREINRSRDSEEIQRLLNLLNEAKRAVDKCSGVSTWNIYKKYKFAKRLIELDNSIRTTLQVFFPVMILEDTTRIVDGVDELKMMLTLLFYILNEDFRSSAKKIAHSQPAEIVNDIAMWKEKKVSGTLLFTSTATWLLQQVYEYNFLTIAAWLALFLVTSLFVWRKANRFLDRPGEATESRLEKIRERVAMEAADACWELTDKAIRWVFDVTDADKDWSVFARTVGLLLVVSYAGSFFDLPTLCKGVMTGTTVPVMLAKHGDKIKSLGMQSAGKLFDIVEELRMDNNNNNNNNKNVKKLN